MLSTFTKKKRVEELVCIEINYSPLIANYVTLSAFFLCVLVKRSFHEVCGGGKKNTKSVKVEYQLIQMTPRTSIIKKAMEFEQNQLYKGAYNAIFQNCEHFARGLVEAGKDKILRSDFMPHGRCTQVNSQTSSRTAYVNSGGL